MTSDHDALISAILATPDEDTPRLALADYYDELGDDALTDQQRARRDWIRMTCNRTGKRARARTGRLTRQAGEPAWIEANVRRLWPGLTALSDAREDGRLNIRLFTGRVVLSLTRWVPVDHPWGSRMETADSIVVAIAAERGITTSILFPFSRAALIAPVAARDEPQAELECRSGPEWAYEHDERGTGEFGVWRRPFMLKNLEGVWDLLPGHATRPEYDGDLLKVWPASGHGRRLDGMDADRKVNKALTEWARKQAAASTATEDAA